jgi:hypothetical protein
MTGATPVGIALGDSHAYLGSVIGTVAIPARRAVGLPSRLVRGLVVLALLVLAAGATLAVPASARVAVADGPACPVASLRVAMLSDAQTSAPEAGRSVFDRTDLCAPDIEILTELGLPRAPIEAPRLRHTITASFGFTSDARAPSVPDGSLHRPPRSI